jgi:D-arabinose 1-dehydrogenase-like Zn-dependent alcohol dehydrogenase
MPCKVKAAVTLGYQQPFVIKDVEVAPPGKDEILVKIVATGVCHTDAVMRDNPGVVPMPAILGHEGAGSLPASARRLAASGRRPRGAQLRRLPPLRKLFKQPPFGLRRF